MGRKTQKSVLAPLPPDPFLPTKRLPFTAHGPGTGLTAAHFSKEIWGNEFLENGCRNRVTDVQNKCVDTKQGTGAWNELRDRD